MNNNTNEILTQTTKEMEGVLQNFIKEFMKEEQENNLNIHSTEKIIGNMIKVIISLIMKMAGNLLSNVVERDDYTCECCKRKLRVNKKSVPLTIMTLYGKLQIKRNELHCRFCGVGRGVNDRFLGINKEHRITNGLAEIITYIGQLMASFEEGKETIKKFLGFMEVEVSASQIQIVTKENGKKVFESDMEKAEKIYEEPEKFIPDLLEKDKKAGTTYTLVDGSQINTRTQDSNGSSWKEMKLVESFCNKNILKRKNGNSVIVKKEYGAVLGNVEKFKKEVLRVAVESGYGIYKEHVVLGDGALWIWNMSKELFPNAVEILDFYHVSENIHEYAKFLYPNNEIKRKKWVKSVLDKLENGKEDKAIKLVNKFKVGKNVLPKGVVNLPEYLENNKTRIKYKHFKKLGYYIGSGAIESGNKTVIQQRMKQSGMRWGIIGGQYIATLRAKYKSNLWIDVVNLIDKSA